MLGEPEETPMPTNTQILLDHRPTGKVSPANFRVVETPVSDARAGRSAGAPYIPVARPVYARAAQRREILRQAAGSRRGDGRGHGRPGRGLEQSALLSGRRCRRHGRLAALFAKRRRDLKGRRREGDPDPGLSRPGRHARRHRLVRLEQDHRAEGGGNGAGLRRDRRGRFGRGPIGEDRRRAAGGHRRRPGEMRLCRQGAGI